MKNHSDQTMIKKNFMLLISSEEEKKKILLFGTEKWFSFLQSLVALLIILEGDVFDQGGQFCPFFGCSKEFCILFHLEWHSFGWNLLSYVSHKAIDHE